MTGWVALDGQDAERCVVGALERVRRRPFLPSCRHWPGGEPCHAGDVGPGPPVDEMRRASFQPGLAGGHGPKFGGPLGYGFCSSGGVTVRPRLLVPSGHARRFLHAHGGRRPELDPQGLAVAMASGRPSLVTYCEPRALVLAEGRASGPATFADRKLVGEALGFIVGDAVEGHLRLLVDAVCSRIRVGRRLLWGNVAASSAVAFRTMEGCSGSGSSPSANVFLKLSRANCKGRAISWRSSTPADRAGTGNAATAALTTGCRKEYVAATAASPRPINAGTPTWPASPTIRDRDRQILRSRGPFRCPSRAMS